MRTRTIFLAIVGFTGIANALALSGEQHPGEKFDHKSLNNQSMRQWNLEGASFVGTDLTGVDLSGANLRDADFESAKIFATVLAGADLQGATFKATGFMFSGGRGVDASNANLEGVTFAHEQGGVPLKFVDFRGACLRKVVFYGDVQECNFRGADLRDANFSLSDPEFLAKSKFTGAYINAATRFPVGFNVGSSGARMLGDNEEPPANPARPPSRKVAVPQRKISATGPAETPPSTQFALVPGSPPPPSLNPGGLNAAPNPPIAPNVPLPASEPNNPTQTGFQKGDKIEVNWGGGSAWFAAQILDVKGDSYYIAYDDYPSNWNEWIGPDRIRARGSHENPAAPKINPLAPAAKGSVLLSGLYVTQRMLYWPGYKGSGSSTSQEYKFYYFFPDGHLYAGVPPGGLCKLNPAAADYPELVKASPEKCGNYLIDGGRLTTTTQAGTATVTCSVTPGNEAAIQIDGNAANKCGDFKPGHRLTGKYLAGGSARSGDGGIQSNRTYSFHADGTVDFETVGTAVARASQDFSPGFGSAEASGTGRYEISGNTLTIAGGGGTQKMTIYRWGMSDEPQPGFLGIDSDMFSLH